MNKRKGLNMEQKRNLTGWAFLLPASILIFVFCFYPMVQALILSFQKGTGSAVQPAGFANYARILKDATFQQCLFNTIFYFVIQVPIMLILALILAQLLNSPDIKGKGIYRTMIFLPCATSLVSYSMIFKSLFANDGLVNRVLSTVGIPTVDWFQNAWAARWVIVIALIWRWTGYNMVFYLAGLQNIDYSIYDARRAGFETVVFIIKHEIEEAFPHPAVYPPDHSPAETHHSADGYYVHLRHAAVV